MSSKKEKSHTLTREFPEGPYVLPVTAPINSYSHKQQPQTPGLFGGNVERKQTVLSTLHDEITQESQGKFQLMQDSSQLVRSDPPTQQTKYTQHLSTSLIQPSKKQVDMSKEENREMSGFFMPSLMALNQPSPLTTGNVQQRLADSFMSEAKQKGFKTTTQDVQGKMEWHTMQFAQQQMVQDSGLFLQAQQQQKDVFQGKMPPPLFSTSKPPTSYQQSIVNEAYQSMQPEKEKFIQQQQNVKMEKFVNTSFDVMPEKRKQTALIPFPGFDQKK